MIYLQLALMLFNNAFQCFWEVTAIKGSSPFIFLQTELLGAYSCVEDRSNSFLAIYIDARTQATLFAGSLCFLEKGLKDLQCMYDTVRLRTTNSIIETYRSL